MRRDRLVRKALRERFVVTLSTGETFDGLLYAADESTLHLVDAFAMDGATRVRVDGALFLPRAHVSYLQRPEGIKA
jgi:small nuclear ribonucleoprotein (snRNP)-like protein